MAPRFNDTQPVCFLVTEGTWGAVQYLVEQPSVMAGRRIRRARPTPAELGSLAEDPLAGLDLATCDTMPPLHRYRDLCDAGFLEAALRIVEGIVHAERNDMLRKCAPVPPSPAPAPPFRSPHAPIGPSLSHPSAVVA